MASSGAAVDTVGVGDSFGALAGVFSGVFCRASSGALSGMVFFDAPGSVASVTSSMTRSAVSASRSAATNSGRTSARASELSSFMCSAAPPSGAAMRKTRSAGPSGAPKSTFRDSLAIARPAAVTDAVRACGIAMPPGSPVADLASRSSAARARSAGSVVRPAAPSASLRAVMTAAGSAPASTSRLTVCAVMIRSVMTCPSRGMGWGCRTRSR